MPQRITLILILLFSGFISSCESMYNSIHERQCERERTPAGPVRCDYPSYETYRQQREQTLNENK
jgi:hypothetical protein